MAGGERLICASADLVPAGPGVRFEVEGSQGPLAAFAVRVLGGLARAYVNRCPHMGTELDWQPGDFFEGIDRELASFGDHRLSVGIVGHNRRNRAISERNFPNLRCQF